MHYLAHLLLILAVVPLAFVLYETLPPLTDTTDPADPRAPDYHFSRSYLAARHKFLTRAKAAGAELAAEVIARDDEIGVDLTMDAAFFKGSRPEKLIVHMSGTHGVEGFAGSAIQAKLLEGLKDGQTAGASVLFVHAVNPFGFHFQRRFNENNVDLNRNWIWSDDAWNQVLARGPNDFGYAELATPFNAPVLYWWQYFTSFARAVTVLPRRAAVQQALGVGQYHDPSGIFYGGVRREASTVALDRVLHRFGDGVKEVYTVDVHSGLGQCGEDTLMVTESDAELLARVAPNSAHRIQALGSGDVGGGYGFTKGFVQSQQSLPLATTSMHVFQEFGTRPGIFVALAVAFENSALRYTHRHSVAHQFARGALLRAFFVDTPQWKQQILERGVSVFEDIVSSVRA